MRGTQSRRSLVPAGCLIILFFSYRMSVYAQQDPPRVPVGDLNELNCSNPSADLVPFCLAKCHQPGAMSFPDCAEWMRKQEEDKRRVPPPSSGTVQ